MKICELCEKSVESVQWDAYSEWLICKVCYNHQQFDVLRSEGVFAD